MGRTVRRVERSLLHSVEQTRPEGRPAATVSSHAPVDGLSTSVFVVVVSSD